MLSLEMTAECVGVPALPNLLYTNTGTKSAPAQLEAVTLALEA
jgi:hypothetical protein